MTELLSPAGEYDSFLGAVNAGADAVYLAGNMYGARANAVNFSEDEIIKALKYAHLFGKKIYLTVNTLTKDEELEKLYDFIRPLYLSGLDACIVQDMGVFTYLKECFPSMDIHISTQAVVTSPDGALFYKNLGASRVVLARELTLPEIEDINKTGIETECFIHGAMCYSYSGACLFSSFLGGNSGNRGRCKGPCRQPYTISGKEDYILSLKDMCTIDILDRLVKSGISSFKIEGRLKSPSYSAGVTSVYRKYIDKILENPDKPYEVDGKDINLLKNLYSRSGSGNGYYDLVKSSKMITFEKGSYSKVNEEDEKIIYEKYVRNLNKLPVSVEIDAKAYEPLRFLLKTENSLNQSVTVESSEIIECASGSPTSFEDIKKHALKMGSTPFAVDKIDIRIDTGFVPASVVNGIRREACEKLETLLTEGFVRADDSKKISTDKKCNVYKTSYNRAFVDNISQFEYAAYEDFYDGVVVNVDILFDERFDKFKDLNKDLYLSFPPFIRNLNKKIFDKGIKLAIRYGFKGLYFNQIDEYMYLKDKLTGFEICGDINIYTYNSLSLQFYKKYFDVLQAPAELNYQGIDSLNANDFEICLYQKAPLMQTANCVMNNRRECQFGKKDTNEYKYLRDRMNADFPVRLRCSDELCFNTVYNSKPTSLHKYYQKFIDKGYTGFSFRFTDENVSQMKDITKYYKMLKKGDIMTNPPFEYTNGHIKSGIL